MVASWGEVDAKGCCRRLGAMCGKGGVTGEFVIRPCVTLCLGEVLKSRAFPPETGSQTAFRAEIRFSSTAVGGFGATCAVWLPRRVPVCSAAGRGGPWLSVPTVAATVRTGAASVRPVAASVCGVLAVSGGVILRQRGGRSFVVLLAVPHFTANRPGHPEVPQRNSQYEGEGLRSTGSLFRQPAIRRSHICRNQRPARSQFLHEPAAVTDCRRGRIGRCRTL